jgi:hypothetical protein
MPKPIISTKSLISPAIDFWCVGGLSIIVMCALILYYQVNGITNNGINFQAILVMQLLINWPHFMASYRLLYAPAGNIKKHYVASLVVPSTLVLLITYAIFSAHGDDSSVVYIDQTITYYIWLIAAFYLAWHYTGQAWGMVAVFSKLAGIKLNGEERFLIRFGLRVLFVWHVTWGAQDLPESWLGPLHPYLPAILNYISLLAFISFFMGVVGFLKIMSRTGKVPSKQMVAPWLAIFLWYLALSINPDAYIFVQVSHALQYLIFPFRVHLNEKRFFKVDCNSAVQFIYAGKYYLILILLGGLVFYSPELLFNNAQQGLTLATLVASAISIHHYFVDGCIWKISNPDVRKRLFKHVQ